MASQRLAYSLRQASRVNKALNAVAPFRRYANPVTPARTESTTLSNGLTVCHSELRIRENTADEFLRSPLSIHHGRRHRQLACGLTQVQELRRKRQTEQLISSNIWLSRSVTSNLKEIREILIIAGNRSPYTTSARTRD